MHTDSIRSTTSVRPWSHRSERGVAMLLVIVALSVGVVLAGIALTSRQPATRIGQNACDDAAARWGAHAAANFAEAVLETAAECVEYSNIESGDFIKTFDVTGGTVTVTLTRHDGSTPQPGDRELLMTAVARVGSMTATVEKQVSIAAPVPINIAADSRLGEFAVFAGTELKIHPDAVVRRSPFLTEADSLVPVKIAAAFSDPTKLDVDKDADMRHTVLCIDGRAPASMDSALADPKYSGGVRLPYTIPLIRDTQRPEVSTLPLLSLVLPILDGVVQTVASGNYLTLTVRNGAVVTLGQPGQKTVYKLSGIVVENSGVLRYQGDVIVQVSGATVFRTLAALEPVDENSRIEMYLGRNVTLDDCAIGLSRAIARNNDRLPADAGAHAKANQVFLSTLNTVNGGSTLPIWDIKGKAIVLASIHAPQSELKIDGDSTLIGRATCGKFEITNGSSLYYDPRLDSRAGYAEIDGPLYVNKLPITEVKNYLGSVSSSAGAQALQDGLKSTLDTFWSANADKNILVKPTGTVEIEKDPIGVDGEVVIGAEGTPDVRVKGKARVKTKPEGAKKYES